jgi:hypothetical protein
MDYEITLHLSDDEHTALVEEATRVGQGIEDVMHRLPREHLANLRRSLSASGHGHLLSKQELQEYLYRKGTIRSIPTGETRTPEEEARLEELGKLFGQGQPLSEMIMEERGPY